MSDTPAAPTQPPDQPGTASDVKRTLGPAGMKLAAIGALVLGLLLPQYFVAGLIGERESRQAEVQSEIARAWGQSQTVLGPLLVVPMRPSLGPDGKPVAPWSIAIPASELSMTATMEPERRRRGLFEAVVYTAQVEFSGRFGQVAAILPADADPDWAGAFLMTGASDLRPATDAPTLRWGERPLTIFNEGAMRCGPTEAMRWPLGLNGPPEPGAAFTGSMELRGTGTLAFVPAARRLQFVAHGPWATPSYVGANLPLRAETDEAGFRAEWAGGMAAQAIRLNPGHCAGNVLPSAMGVALLEPVPTYRMVNRTAKYAVLFVLLAVMTYWLFEITARIRIHLVQYGLLGLSMVLFPLLLLAIAETLGFGVAYVISAAMVMGQAGLYTAAVTGRVLLATIFAGVLGVLFGFLYVVLRMESMALLAGALGLFALLSAVMAATRRMGTKEA
ncbi:cell envelope integrity protein CreD [Roseomonas terrae]|uniref:Cell envelope integrity protein CreD n=1 Tax=Neoroseomonas terrae TaxID=424799 RepID=A0ABS5EQ00_9PROT|nr:cell envelope integrity protein CreD [Neoroseomonas terrae]MBR0653077.1 cell envelope integrity protein CreD [Neoroseomonas terrae]